MVFLSFQGAVPKTKLNQSANVKHSFYSVVQFTLLSSGLCYLISFMFFVLSLRLKSSKVLLYVNIYSLPLGEQGFLMLALIAHVVPECEGECRGDSKDRWRAEDAVMETQV